MDPLSIVSGIIAVCQAGERMGGIISCIQTLANAPGEIAALIDEISNIRATLSDLYFRVLTSPEAFGGSGCIHQVLETCLGQVQVLEDVVANSVINRDKLPFGRNLDTASRTKRMAWLRKRKKIERVKQELRLAISIINLELLSLSL